jgi:hypothetical protein
LFDNYNITEQIFSLFLAPADSSEPSVVEFGGYDIETYGADGEFTYIPISKSDTTPEAWIIPIKFVQVADNVIQTDLTDAVLHTGQRLV